MPEQLLHCANVIAVFKEMRGKAMSHHVRTHPLRDAGAPGRLFQVISRRYEQRSIVVTTNLLFKQWDTVFPNASCAVALIDRLTHHAEIIPIEGESYRKREAERTQKQRRGTA